MIPPYDEATALRDPAVHLYPAFAAAGSEAMAQIVQQCPTWRTLPRVMDFNAAFDIRLAAAGGGGSTRVDFKRVLTRHVAARFADFQPGFLSSDRYRYVKPLTDDLVLCLEWHHVSGKGIGKIMQVHVGARYKDKVAIASASLPRFWGRGEQASWTYTTAAELQAGLNAAADFLDVFLPPFGAALTAHMTAGTFPINGPLTAREAFVIAKERLASLPDGATQRFTGASLCVGSWRFGASAGSDGRTRVHAGWNFGFRDAAQNVTSITVPHLGAPQCLQMPPLPRRAEPIPEPWVDSSDAMRAVCEDPFHPPEARLVEFSLGDHRPNMPNACWQVHFVIPGTTRGILAWIDAATGAAKFAGSMQE